MRLDPQLRAEPVLQRANVAVGPRALRGMKPMPRGRAADRKSWVAVGPQTGASLPAAVGPIEGPRDVHQSGPPSLLIRRHLAAEAPHTLSSAP